MKKQNILLTIASVFLIASCGGNSGGNGQKKDGLIKIENFGTARLEAEDFDTSAWVSDDSYKGKILIDSDAASGGKYLAAGARDSQGICNFKFELTEYSKVVFKAAYAQTEEWLDSSIDLGVTYKYSIENVSPFTNTSSRVLRARDSAEDWEVMEYEPQTLYPGVYSVTLSVLPNTPKGCPSIDYVEFVTSDANEDIKVDPSKITEVPDNDFHNLQQYKYLMDDDWRSFKTYANGSDLSAPDAIKLRFEDLETASKYYVQVSESEDFSNSPVYETTEKVYKLYNAKLSTTYYYRAAADKDNLDNADVKYITSTSLAPRVVKVDKVLNFRDIGGWSTSLVPGAKLNQGLYFRCAQLNQSGSSSTKSEITSAGIKTFQELGIKVDIDMRDSYNIPKASPANTTEWPVKLVNASIASGTEPTRWEAFGDVYKLIFETIANADKEPVALHCTYGADRTGIASVFLEGLLGMSEEDMARDYVWTKFTQGRDPNPDGEFAKWMEKTKTQYDDETFADKWKHHLMTKGISESTLEHIREIFIPGYVAKA